MDNNTMVPPASATVNDGLMLYMDMEGQSQLYPVRYALDGSDVYLGDLSANVKGYWIKGTMDGTTVTFPATSFVGIDTLTAWFDRAPCRWFPTMDVSRLWVGVKTNRHDKVTNKFRKITNIL